MTSDSNTGSTTPEKIKGFHRKFVTGVTVVTTMEDELPRGLVVNAFSSLSIDPPFILVCVQKTSVTHPALFARDHLAVNIAASDMEAEVMRLAGKDPDKFSGIDWSPGPYGSPVLDGAAAWLEAEITERLQASTHTLFIARVLAAGTREKPPLLYASGKFYDGTVLEQTTP